MNDKYKISLSARKHGFYPMSDWVRFMRSHSKRHGGPNIEYSNIDYVFGIPQGESPLFGGREKFLRNVEISKMDEYWAYDKGIGLKIPLSGRGITTEAYNSSKALLHRYHREGNAIIVSEKKLAEYIRQDFPLYSIEVSAVKAVESIDAINEACASELYDTIVLPIHMNDKIETLEKIDSKESIRLFMNVECSYTCPNKICYGSISKINKGDRAEEKMMCSHWDLKQPRTFYNDSIDWGKFYFDVPKYVEMGFSKFKLVPPLEEEQRLGILYEYNKL